MRAGLRRRRDSQDEDGAVAVEFALVVPILLLVVFGIIAFGFIFAQQLSLGNAARQGARYGVVADRTCADIFAEARNNADGLAMKKADVVIVVSGCASETSTIKPCAGSVAGQNVSVEATYTSPVIVPVPFLADEINLTGKGTFRCEFS